MPGNVQSAEGDIGKCSVEVFLLRRKDPCPSAHAPLSISNSSPAEFVKNANSWTPPQTC